MKIQTLATGTLAMAMAVVAGCSDSPTETHSMNALQADAAHSNHSPRGGADIGTTAGWLKGQAVTFFYNQQFDCVLPADAQFTDEVITSTAATSNCVLAAEATRPPRGGNDPVVYVTVPLFENTDGITLHCPVSGDCINHPSTIDLSRVFGAGTENAALPAHSHVVDVRRGGWWKIEVNGVTTREAWDAIESKKSLAEIRNQQALGTVTPDLDTNLFLFFNVMPKK